MNSSPKLDLFALVILLVIVLVISMVLGWKIEIDIKLVILNILDLEKFKLM